VLRAREPEWFEHRLFKGPDADINLHVFTAGAGDLLPAGRGSLWLRGANRGAEPGWRPPATASVSLRELVS